MRTLILKPHEWLRPFVHSYRIVEDLPGDYVGKPITTCPEPVGILSINLGRPSFHESGGEVPKVGFLGIQTYTRQWISQSETLFVMAMLTVPGMMVLLPSLGNDSADKLLDLSDVWGDQKANQFSASFPDRWEPVSMKLAMDQCLFRLAGFESDLFSTRSLRMYNSLLSHGRVDQACKNIGMSARTMQREFKQHLGMTPRQIMGLHRLQYSLKVSCGGKPEETGLGYSDQAHQIRSWRRYLGRTPGSYRAKDRSMIARRFAPESNLSNDQPIFYL